MRHALAALLFAAPICAFAAPALAQTVQGYDYGPAGPVGAVVTAPFYVLFAVLSGPFDWNAFPTVTANTGARPIATAPHRPSPAPNGHCDIVSGQRVCYATP